MRFLEELGIPPLTRHGTWIYPHAEQAAAVLNALRTELEQLGVKIETDARILGIRQNQKGGFAVKTEKAEFRADRVVAALGGAALPRTGSDGIGAELVARLGLKLQPLRPALCPLRSAERENTFFRASQGVRVPAALSLWVDGKKVAEENGELQLTKEGFSGISVFQLSLPAGRALQHKQRAELMLNFLPDLKADLSLRSAVCSPLRRLLKPTETVLCRRISGLLFCGAQVSLRACRRRAFGKRNSRQSPNSLRQRAFRFRDLRLTIKRRFRQAESPCGN